MQKSKRNIVKTFIWGWREKIPLKAIIKFAQNNPHLKAFEIDNGTDQYQIAFGPNSKIVEKRLIKQRTLIGSAKLLQDDF